MASIGSRASGGWVLDLHGRIVMRILIDCGFKLEFWTPPDRLSQIRIEGPFEAHLRARWTHRRIQR